jgi:very-short-patch-repair endonuclease
VHVWRQRDPPAQAVPLTMSQPVDSSTGRPLHAGTLCIMNSIDNVVRVITRCGGIVDAGTLVGLTSKHAVMKAVEREVIVRDARGRYALPTAQVGIRTANRLSAVMSHTSAAAHWGWEMREAPARATVSVPRNRKVPAEARECVDIFWRPMAHGRVGSALVTSPIQTVLDCARWLSFDAALAIADSALRHGSVTRAELTSAYDSFRGHGRAQVLRVIEAADARSDNPFESVLRAISLDVPGLNLVPQVEIRIDGRRLMRPDLVDERLRIVVEADSFEHHGSRKALVLDCARYDNLVSDGWTVLRFSWEHVMYRPVWVRSTLVAVTDRLVDASEVGQADALKRALPPR